MDPAIRAQPGHPKLVQNRHRVGTFRRRQRISPHREDPPVTASVQITHVNMPTQDLRHDRPCQHGQIGMLAQNPHQNMRRAP